MSLTDEMKRHDVHMAANSLSVAIADFGARDDLTETERGAVMAVSGAMDKVFRLCWRRGFDAEQESEKSLIQAG